LSKLGQLVLFVSLTSESAIGTVDLVKRINQIEPI